MSISKVIFKFINHVVVPLKIRLNKLRFYYVKLKFSYVNFGHNTQLFGMPLLDINRKATVDIGNDVVFRSDIDSNFVGIYKPVSIFVNEGARLKIGNNTGFSGSSIYCNKQIEIGNNVNCGGNVAIWDTQFHPLNFQDRRINDVKKIKSLPVLIQDDVFIGANSLILCGVTVGARAVIGAGSIVTKNIPSDEIWAGNPAKFIRKA